MYTYDYMNELLARIEDLEIENKKLKKQLKSLEWTLKVSEDAWKTLTNTTYPYIIGDEEDVNIK